MHLPCPPVVGNAEPRAAQPPGDRQNVSFFTIRCTLRVTVFAGL